MADHIEEKIKNYRTAPFDARFPNTNQTRNCYQNYLGKLVDRFYTDFICLCRVYAFHKFHRWSS